ncbi:MAG: NAD(P)-binding protein [Gammaproteobacteria bacterium]|nr:NAD(P)-binding protein [Gammaproteobacteria bacterium]
MKKILIVGAGIAGLSLARQLEKFFIPFDLIEKRPALAAKGAGILPAKYRKFALQIHSGCIRLGF